MTMPAMAPPDRPLLPDELGVLGACVAVSVGVAVTVRATAVAVLMNAAADAAVAKTVLAVDCSAATEVPGVGSYAPPPPPAGQYAKGVVTLQKFARGRKSRGLFKQALLQAGQVPAVGAYDPKRSALSKAAAGRNFASALSGTPRFEGPSSIHGGAPAGPAAAQPAVTATAKHKAAAAPARRHPAGGPAGGGYERLAVGGVRGCLPAGSEEGVARSSES